MKAFLLGITLFATGWISAAITTGRAWAMSKASLAIAVLGAVLLAFDGLRAWNAGSNTPNQAKNDDDT